MAAIRGCSRISGAHCVECAAARSAACPARDVRSPPRVSPLRGIALWKPQPAQPPRSQRAERGLAERMRSPARRATACPSLEYLLWTDPPFPGCAASLTSRSPALGHTSATLQPHTAPAQQPAVPCAFVPLLLPASGSLSHSRPASVRPLRRWSSRSVVTFGLPFPELPCSRSCSARSLCLCAAGRWQPLSATPTQWEWVRAGMS